MASGKRLPQRQAGGQGMMGDVSTPPGIRRIDPDAEAARLAREREDPPWREWGIRHPNGKITVRIDGHAFPSRAEAGAGGEVDDCDACDGGPHTLVFRDRQPWREAP